MDRSLRKTRASDGQALLLAVLIMIAILLIGSLFVAVVNYNQRASGRHTQLVKALSLAKAGMAHANEMLQFSPQGLDWRPELPPFQYTDGSPGPGFWGPDGIPYTYDDYYSYQEFLNGWYPLVHVGPDGIPGTDDDYYIRRGFTRYPDMGGGHFLLRVTYDPDPPYEPWQLDDPTNIPDLHSKHIKIESIGVTEDEGFVSRKVQAYKPVALANYLLFVSDRSRRGYPTILGYNPDIDMDKDGALDFFSPEFAGIPTTYTYNGPMRFNTDVQFTGGNQNGAAAPDNPSNKILLVNGDTNGDGEVNDPGDGVTGPITGQDFSNPLWGGYLRDDYFATHGQVTDELFGSTGQICAAFDVLIAGVAALEDLDSDRVQERVDWLSAPDLFAQDPATGTMRWDALTREAGVTVHSTYTGSHPDGDQWSDHTVNTSELGWMWDKNGNQIAGLYIDNKDDIQFRQPNRRSNISKLMQDWLNPQPGTGDSGWNALGEVYDNAKAVEIELFPSEPATIEDAALSLGCGLTEVDVVSATDVLLGGATTGPDGNEIWWPHHQGDGDPTNNVGEPGIRVTRDAEQDGDDGGLGNGQWALGDPNYSGDIGKQVGRTMYVDYPADRRAVIFAEGNVRIKGRLPEENVDGTGRQYHLTVVSGGTIYIDGQILSPQDQQGRDPGDGGGGLPDEYNTYIALLARDCVVVNPTMLVTQWTDKNQVAVQSDQHPTDPGSLKKHWNFQDPSQSYTTSNFYLGYNSGNDIKLVAYQTMDTNGVRLTRPFRTTHNILYVPEASSTGGPFAGAIQITVKAAGSVSGGEVLNVDTVGDGWIRVTSSPSANYPIGSFVEVTGQPWVSGVSLAFYDAAAGTWQPYDFSSVASSKEIFLLTRRDLINVDWRWEMAGAVTRLPMWCPLQQNDATPHWPWSISSDINAAAGALNTLSFWLPSENAIRTANDDGSTPTGTVRNYWLKKFKLQEFDGTTPVGTIHAKINAVMYAQNGCFFVIPGRYFKEDTSEPRSYLRYNYDVEIRGAITENFHPAPAVVREWQEKWAYPYTAPDDTFWWNSIRYVYDETLLAARTQPLTTLSGGVLRSSSSASWHSNTVKVPLLPASSDLLYYGEVP